MKLYSSNEYYKLYHGNMLDMLEVIEPNTIDSIITDPPYELNFMNKGWDNSGIAFQKETWGKCYEVLKPGGYLLAFGGTRTFHRIAVAIEDAGFEIRDTIMWLYGSGFPKGLNIGLALDKKNGVDNRTGNIVKGVGSNNTNSMKNGLGESQEFASEYEERKAQNEWNGWGTTLKPSFEPIIVARKPFDGSLVDNVIKYGVGGINIDECRIFGKDKEELQKNWKNRKSPAGFGNNDGTIYGDGIIKEDELKEYTPTGRFPANTILTYDETDFNEVCGGFPITKSGSKMSFGGVRKKQPDNCYKLGFTQKEYNDGQNAPDNYGDSGSASRYFYCAKASKKDREEGLEHIKNIHPTVKATELMQYLIRLVSPNGAIILDPFNGSGSTGKAVMYENKERNKNYKYIGIELTEEYLPISKARIEYLINTEPEEIKQDIPTEQTSIFDFM